MDIVDKFMYKKRNIGGIELSLHAKDENGHEVLFILFFFFFIIIIINCLVYYVFLFFFFVMQSHQITA